MSEIQELIDAVEAVGVTIRANGPNLVLNPASKVPPALKARLKEHKGEILKNLSIPRKSPSAEDSWEWITERTAILQFDGGLDSDSASHQAFMLWFNRFIGGSEAQ